MEPRIICNVPFLRTGTSARSILSLQNRLRDIGKMRAEAGQGAVS